MADGYGGKPLPFFKNFYAGGIASVRGYRSRFAGAARIVRRQLRWAAIKRLVGNAELLFPFPGMGKDKSVRLGVFVDGGTVFGPDDD